MNFSPFRASGPLLAIAAVLFITTGSGHAASFTFTPTGVILPDVSTWATFVAGVGSLLIFRRR